MIKMDFLQSAGLGIVAAVICLLLKQYRPEFALVAAVACGALLLLSVVSALSPVFSAIEELVGQTGVTPAYLQLVLKAFGICYLAQLAADTLPRCGAKRHCGENRACRARGGSRSFPSAFSGNRTDGSRSAPKRMKRLFLFVLIFWSVGTGVLLAASSEEDILSQSGADELYDMLPEDTQNLLSEKGVESMDANALLDFSFGDLFAMVWESVKNAAGAPIKLFAAGAGLALLCALTAQVGGTLREDSFSGLFHAASVLCASAVIFPIVTDLFQTVSAVLQSAGSFYHGLCTGVQRNSCSLRTAGERSLVRDGAFSGRSDCFGCEFERADPAFNGLSCALYGGGGMSRSLYGRHHGRGEGNCNSDGGPLMTVFVGLLSLNGPLPARRTALRLERRSLPQARFFRW